MLNGVREITEERARKILVQGLDYKPSEARQMINTWLAEDYAEKARINIEAIGGVPLSAMQMVEIPLLTLDSEYIPVNDNDLANLPLDKIKRTVLPKKMHDQYPNGIYAVEVENGSAAPYMNTSGCIYIAPLFKYVGAERTYLLDFNKRRLVGKLVKNDGKQHYEVHTAGQPLPPIPFGSNELKVCGIVVGSMEEGYYPGLQNS
jgi:hypothetical protein